MASRDQNEMQGTTQKKRRSSSEGEAPRRRRPPSETGEAPRRKKRPPSETGEAPKKRRPPSETGEAPKKRRPPSETGEAPRRKKRPPSAVEEAPRRRPDTRSRQPVRSYEEDDELFMMGANGAKSTNQHTGKRKKSDQRKEARKNKTSRRVGIGLAVAQFVASIIFIVALLQLNMLPWKYLAAVIVVLILLCGVLLAGQLLSKKNAVTGKVISIIMTIVLLVGSFYIFKTSATLSSLNGNNVKVDNMVVAVLLDDPAETIEDAVDYSFGAQYTLGGEDVTTAIDEIESEVGSSIDVTEYSDIGTLASALQSGEVQAIVYNEAYAGVIEDDNPDYASEIKIIYTHAIETELSIENEAADVNVNDDCFFIYISGIDVYGSINQTSRSDVNIIAQVNPTTNEILLITTPRDYYVQIPEVTNGSYDKLTHAGLYGVDASMSTLEELYDIDIDFYIRVNFTSLIEMVDALGGVSVYSEYSFTSTLHAGLYTLYVQEGYNDFDGTDALIFARERLNLPGGDNQRGVNQQEIIKAMIEKMTSPAIISGANDLLESVSGNVETNMTDEQMQTLIKTQVDTGAEWTIESVSATGTGSSESCYSYSGGSLYVTIPDYDSVDLIKEQIAAVEAGGTIADVESDTETEE